MSANTVETIKAKTTRASKCERLMAFFLSRYRRLENDEEVQESGDPQEGRSVVVALRRHHTDSEPHVLRDQIRQAGAKIRDEGKDLQRYFEFHTVELAVHGESHDEHHHHAHRKNQPANP